MVNPEIRWVGVVVPARNEGDLLSGCLENLTAAARIVEVPVRIVVVLDDCTDGSGAVCDHLGIDSIHIRARNVGQARATGFDALIGGEASPASVWLASTDADTQVEVTWIRDQLELARSGTDVVIGVVRLSSDETSLERRSAHEADYAKLFAKDGSHGHVHGANLGVRANVYLHAGGFPPLPNHEDRHLVRRLRSLGGVTIVTSQSLSVITSDRSNGRCDQGFAATLTRLPH